MYSRADLQLEAQEALDTVWFVQSVEQSGSLYFALIEGRQRIFGLDLEGGEWHLHPYSAPDQHAPLEKDLGPKPLLTFLAKVEEVLLQHDLL